MGAGHQRVATELETAARCCRLVEREISQRVDELLAGQKEQPSTAPEYFADTPSAEISPRTSLANRLREIFRRNADSRRPAETEPAAAKLSIDRFAKPIHISTQADVATWALGPLEVHVAGRRLAKWNSLKARAVFQYLLIHQDRPIRRDVLMELQWPNHSHNSARNNLNVALYSLRNTLDGLGHSAPARPVPRRLLLPQSRADVVGRPQRVPAGSGQRTAGPPDEPARAGHQRLPPRYRALPRAAIRG